MIRQPIITVLGHVDHGKCVTADTLLPLVDGRILSAKAIFDLYSINVKKEEVKDGEVYAVQNRPEVFSLSENSVIKKKISHIWRLKSPKRLITVKIRSGDEITVTPEHPFFLLTADMNIEKKQAKDIHEGDFIVVPKLLKRESDLLKVKEHLFEKICIQKDFIVFLDKQKSKRFIKKLASENMQELYRKGLFTTHPASCKQYLRFRARDFLQLCKYFEVSPIDAYTMISQIKNASEGWRAGHTSNKLQLPQTATDFKKLGYILGCLVGDGYILGGVLNNNDKEIQDRYIKYLSEVFGLDSKVKQGHTCRVVFTNGGLSLIRFLVDVIGFPCISKSANVAVPI